ncbi:putative leucine-rich repeat-containing protein DDB_G0290503 isoform X2 [Leptidea sinapis]|uniref:putative leucine-rich repeat-containing protein DDB_G0290503 isoform X2 n=1 Tax=Leptidea sinapis TaxID=189913 RepID=UPI0021C322D5|nr:putative leucine-rich repeat-containing protein DDB_G0290503 isoform X2 [Leptidea sinapis]
MEMSDISKVANQRRVTQNADQLREKFSRETAKIIKLKVAQDTAYWDLEQKLQQVQDKHERLQQNMVELQMQYENVSGQYQDELRWRPETLNKLNSTRAICDVLEDYCERLKQTLSSCKSDQGALSAAYQDTAQIVRDLKAKHKQAEDKSKQDVSILESKVQQSIEHNRQLMEMFEANKQQIERELKTASENLADRDSLIKELSNKLSESNTKYNTAQSEMFQKNECIITLQRQMEHMVQEISSQSDEIKKAFLNKEKELEEAMESNATLKTALRDKEQYAKTLSDQNGSLQDKLTELEQMYSIALNTVEDFKIALTDASNKEDNLNTVIATLTKEKQDLLDDMKKKDEDASNVQEKLNTIITTLTEEKQKLLEDIKQKDEDASNKEDNLNTLIATLTKEKQDLLDDMKKKDEDASNVHEKLNTIITTLTEEKQKLLADIKEKDELIKSQNDKIDNLTESLETRVKEISDTAIELASALQEVENLKSSTEKLQSEKLTLNEQLEALQNEFKAHRDSSEQESLELRNSLVEKDKELDSKTTVIMNLISELNSSTSAQNKIQSELVNCRMQLEAEIEKVKLGDAANKEKEEELSKQMSTICEMRSEMAQLQEHKARMQEKIDNIQKELTGRPPISVPVMQPEHDDNAVMLTPVSNKNTSKLRSPPLIKQQEKEAVTRRYEPQELENMLYNIFSDNSTDDSLHVGQVKRRYAAISQGRQLPPPMTRPNGGAKRRSAVSSAQAEQAKKPAYSCDVQKSQEKNDFNDRKRFFKSRVIENKDKK